MRLHGNASARLGRLVLGMTMTAALAVTLAACSSSGTAKQAVNQSGSKLNGTIQLSNPGTSLPIHGRVAGGSIRFGTVGSYAITYSGTVSGNSMSGSYQVHAGNVSGGPWNASKTS